MKAKTKSIAVELNEHEAISVINALQSGIKAKEFERSPEEEGARRLLYLLRGNFQSSVTGVHTHE